VIESILHILIDYRVALVQGLWVTGELCLIIWTSGLFLGAMLGVLAHRFRFFQWLVVIGSFFVASVPILVLLFWLHYPLQELLGIVLDPFFTTVFTISAVNVLLVVSVLRVALNDFPKEYVVAGMVCGLLPWEIILKIQLPMLFRQVLPQLLSIQINMLHLTLFGSLISVEEIFRAAQRSNAMVYKPVEIYTAVAILFILVCLPVNLFAAWCKEKMTRNLSDR